MAVRLCPHCRVEVSAQEAAARSNEIECPKCGTRLEIASGSRTIGTIAGLLAGVIVWRLSAGLSGDLGAVLPTLYAFLAFGVVSALVVMFTANLQNAPALPAPMPDHGHGASGAAGGGHGPGPAAHGGGHH